MNQANPAGSGLGGVYLAYNQSFVPVDVTRERHACRDVVLPGDIHLVGSRFAAIFLGDKIWHQYVAFANPATVFNLEIDPKGVGVDLLDLIDDRDG